MLWGSVNPLKGSPPLFLFKRFDTWYVHHSQTDGACGCPSTQVHFNSSLTKVTWKGLLSAYYPVCTKCQLAKWTDLEEASSAYFCLHLLYKAPLCVFVCVCACTLRQMGGNCLLTIQQNRSIVKIVWMRCDQIKVGALMEKDDVKSWQRWLQCECKIKHTSANEEICY